MPSLSQFVFCFRSLKHFFKKYHILNDRNLKISNFFVGNLLTSLRKKRYTSTAQRIRKDSCVLIYSGIFFHIKVVVMQVRSHNDFALVDSKAWTRQLCTSRLYVMLFIMLLQFIVASPVVLGDIIIGSACCMSRFVSSTPVQYYYWSSLPTFVPRYHEHDLDHDISGRMASSVSSGFLRVVILPQTSSTVANQFVTLYIHMYVFIPINLIFIALDFRENFDG
jgi:hypothetical protein